MPARKTTPEKPKKASGANIEEWQRSGRKVQFRLNEEHANQLEEYAAQQEYKSVDKFARHLIETMLANPDATCGALLADLRGPYG